MTSMTSSHMDCMLPDVSTMKMTCSLSTGMPPTSGWRSVAGAGARRVARRSDSSTRTSPRLSRRSRIQPFAGEPDRLVERPVLAVRSGGALRVAREHGPQRLPPGPQPAREVRGFLERGRVRRRRRFVVRLDRRRPRDEKQQHDRTEPARDDIEEREAEDLARRTPLLHGHPPRRREQHSAGVRGPVPERGRRLRIAFQRQQDDVDLAARRRGGLAQARGEQQLAALPRSPCPSGCGSSRRAVRAMTGSGSEGPSVTT